MPLHPVVIHVPLALAVLVPIAALGVLLAWWRRWLPGRTWVVVVGLQAVLVAGGIVALQTGEADEERVEAIVTERVLEAHEDAAKSFVFSSAGVLALSVLPLLGRNEARRRGFAAATAAASLVVAALAVDVGHMGGELVYEHGAASAYAPVKSTGAGSDDDDD